MAADEVVYKPGVAYIKAEYLAVSTPTSDGAAPSASQGDGQPPTGEGAAKRAADDGYHQQGGANKKRKGQNKQRPRLVREARCNKLCRFVWAMTEQGYREAVQRQADATQPSTASGGEQTNARTESTNGTAEVTSTAPDSGSVDTKQSPASSTSGHPLCPYSNCAFSHDVDRFLLAKPQDIADTCHNFDTFGHCHYGLICRFGSKHIHNGFNVINEQLWSTFKDVNLTSNNLPDDIKIQLRKKRYNFCKSKAALNEAQSDRDNKINSAAATTTVATTPAATTPAATTPAVTTPAADCSTETENSATAQPETSTTAAASSGDGSGSVGQAVEQSSSGAVQGAASNGTKDVAVASSVITSNGTKDVAVDDTASNGIATYEARIGPAADDDMISLRCVEKRKVVWRDQLYLAPLTTLGNLPFRRICRRLGADITCGEMAVATCLLQGHPSEWALVKRHHTEAVFGVQLCGSNPEAMIRCSEVLSQVADMDFVDINVGCPIDFIYKQGGGSGLMRRTSALELMVRGMAKVLPCPVTVKMRTAIHVGEYVAHTIIPRCGGWGADLVTLHGRSREQRYTRSADWAYIGQCAQQAAPLPLYGNGDVLNYEDYRARKAAANVTGIMIGRGALMKPWLFTEIKEQRHWDIASSERYDILKEFVNNGMEHWGSDSEGVEKTRRFLLEWLSFLHRYIPLGLLERPPQAINQKPPQFVGRDHLETLMASKSSMDWIKISEMLLGPVPDDFVFLPKHRANSWG